MALVIINLKSHCYFPDFPSEDPLSPEYEYEEINSHSRRRGNFTLQIVQIYAS